MIVTHLPVSSLPRTDPIKIVGHLYPAEAYDAGSDVPFANNRVAVCDLPDTSLYSIGGNQEPAGTVLGRRWSERKQRAAAAPKGGKALAAGEEAPSRRSTGDFHLRINQGVEI